MKTIFLSVITILSISLTDCISQNKENQELIPYRRGDKCGYSDVNKKSSFL